MVKAYKGLIAEIKAEAWAACERNIIMRLLKNHSIEEVAKFLSMTPEDISRKLGAEDGLSSLEYCEDGTN